MSTPLPAFQMDVTGEYGGNAYPEQVECRVHMAQSGEIGPESAEHPVVLWVEDSSGDRLGQMWFSPEEIEGILWMALTNHGLDGYEDDWSLPVGMDRRLVWTLPTDNDHFVQIDETQIDEMAAWLRFATGEDEWTGGDEWEF
jgi:hypothetical protein